MSVCLAYRIPGEGAVLACDGRVTSNSDSTILSEAEKKYVICGGSSIVLLAGEVGPIWVKLMGTPPKNYKAFRHIVGEHSTHDLEWVTYDRKKDQIIIGDVVSTRPIAGIGCGAPFGLGALEALPLAKTLADAQKAISSAMAIACRRNAACGGRIRIITIPKKGAIQFGVHKDSKNNGGQ